MIGVNNSPLSMFNGSIDSSGPSMYQIGYNGGPGGGINAALAATIDRYHANLDAQNEQANKLAQIAATSTASLGNEKALVDYKNKNRTPVPFGDKFANFDPLHPPTQIIGGQKTIIAPTYTDGVLDGVKYQTPGAYPPITADPSLDFKSDTVDTLDQPPIPGVTTTPEVIKQGANGAVVDATGKQTPQASTVPWDQQDHIAEGFAKRNAAIKILKGAGKLVTEATIQSVLQKQQRMAAQQQGS